MKGTIPNDFVRQIIAQTDIVDVISRYVKLKKTGRNHMACCPFHHEKTPSFSVNQQKQIYHCFGCHASGNVITFLLEHEHLSFVEAVEELASMHGLSVPYEKGSGNDQEQFIPEIYDALNESMKFFCWSMRYDQKSTEVIEYLKARGISGVIAKLFLIGYAPDKWQSLYDLLKKKYRFKVLEKAGVIIAKKQGGAYDRFRDRLMFPIRNRKGKVIAFGGRILTDKKDQPKYLNSPETPVFYKSQELYGLYELKQQNKRPDHIMVVEGYMDVVGLAQYGYFLAVATLGTAVSQAHIKQLFRETDHIVLCFDGDSAGMAASMRAFQIVLPMLSVQKKVSFFILPQGEDPDSYIQKVGLADFKEQALAAYSAADFFLEYLFKDKDVNKADDIAAILELAKEVLKEIPENSYSTSITQHLANKLNLSALQLQRMFKAKSHKDEAINLQRWQLNTAKLSITERTLAFALAEPQKIHYVLSEQKNIEFTCITEQHFILLDALKIIRQNSGLSSAMVIQVLAEKYGQFQQYFQQLLRVPLELDSEVFVNEFDAMLQMIIEQACQNELEHLINKAKASVLTVAETQRMQEILHKVEKL